MTWQEEQNIITLLVLFSVKPINQQLWGKQMSGFPLKSLIWSRSKSQPNWIKLKLDQSSKCAVIGRLLVFRQQRTQFICCIYTSKQVFFGYVMYNLKDRSLCWIDLISSHTSAAGDKDTSLHAPLWTWPVEQELMENPL